MIYFLVFPLAFFLVAVSIALVIVIFNLISLLLIRVPYVNTPANYLAKIISQLEVRPGAVIYDLGCGSGDFLRLAQKLQPSRCIGLEISPWAYFVASLKNWRYQKINIKLKDFIKEDVGSADLVYIYLLPRLMERISVKLKQELKAGAIIVTVGSPLPGWSEESKVILEQNKNYSAFIYRK